jgi:hypothetical protein
MQPAVVELYQQLGQSRPIYNAYKKLRQSGTLDATQLRKLLHSHSLQNIIIPQPQHIIPQVLRSSPSEDKSSAGSG